MLGSSARRATGDPDVERIHRGVRKVDDDTLITGDRCGQVDVELKGPTDVVQSGGAHTANTNARLT